MNEQSVDKDLEKFLEEKNNLVTSSPPKLGDEIESEALEASEPSLTSQHVEIIDLLTSLRQDQIPLKQIEIMKCLKDMSHLEAEALIKCLSRNKTRSFSKTMTQNMVENVLCSFFKLSNKTDISAIKNDEVLLNEMSDWVSVAVDYLGFWKGPLLLLYYGLSSKFKEERKSYGAEIPEQALDNDETTIQNDGSSTFPDG